MRADHVGIKPGRRFGDPPLRGIVDVDDAKPLRIAMLPLEVVEERPDKIAAQIDACPKSLPRRLQMFLQVFYTLDDRSRCHSVAGYRRRPRRFR